MSEIKKFLDKEGIEYLWSKISMEDYPNNETLIAVLNAIDETKADKDYVNTAIEENSKQADWAQTDETAMDFIKNKPDVATDDDIIELMLEMDVMPIVQDADGTILIDSDNTVILT